MRVTLKQLWDRARNHPEQQEELLTCLLTSLAIGAVLAAGLMVLTEAGVI